MKQLEKNSLLIIAGLVLFTIMFGIGGVPLLDPDEPVYAETAREMIQFNDFLSPRIFGNYWYYGIDCKAYHKMGEEAFS